jgi:UDP-sulfoquinovose synthase
LLAALTQLNLNAHVVHIGSLGSYGYGGVEDFCIPEGYVNSKLQCDVTGKWADREIKYPADPGSVYHMTKVIDAELFHFYNKNDRLRITDLYQGIVWGTQTEETKMHCDLVNRFDYDGDYGTVLNRFLVQAIVGHPLTVYGSGDRMRGFIHIQNTVECVQLAIENPPRRGERVQIINQTAEQCNLHGLAERVSNLLDAEVRYYTNPRVEADKNVLRVSNASLINMGLSPKLLDDKDLLETCEIVEKHKDRVDKKKIICTSRWRKGIRIDSEGKKREDFNKTIKK